jgi:transcriptional regulator with XRE-family HTH domain
MSTGATTPQTEAEQQRSYILGVMSRTGWSQTVLAQRAGLDPSTLSRFLSPERPGHALRESTLRKIAQASRVPWSDQNPPVAGFAESEATPLIASHNDVLTALIAGLAAEGHNIDPWCLKSAVLENAGYRRGDILLVKLGETPLPGDVVCAQIFDWAKSRAETVFRIYHPPYLVAASSDLSALKPLLLDDAAISLRGVVIHTIRSRENT